MGRLGPRPEPLLERLWRHSEVRRGPLETACYIWTASTSCGYGQIGLPPLEPGGKRRTRQCHRVAYELLVDRVPKGWHLHHRCETPRCWNPEHLQPLPHRDHMLIGVGPAGTNARKTHCKHGHEFTPENTRWYGWKGRQRQCIACQNRRNHEAPPRQRRKAA